LPHPLILAMTKNVPIPTAPSELRWESGDWVPQKVTPAKLNLCEVELQLLKDAFDIYYDIQLGDLDFEPGIQPSFSVVFFSSVSTTAKKQSNYLGRGRGERGRKEKQRQIERERERARERETERERQRERDRERRRFVCVPVHVCVCVCVCTCVCVCVCSVFSIYRLLRTGEQDTQTQWVAVSSGLEGRQYFYLPR
jgi:hypothetical protein